MLKAHGRFARPIAPEVLAAMGMTGQFYTPLSYIGVGRCHCASEFRKAELAGFLDSSVESGMSPAMAEAIRAAAETPCRRHGAVVLHEFWGIRDGQRVSFGWALTTLQHYDRILVGTWLTDHPDAKLVVEAHIPYISNPPALKVPDDARPVTVLSSPDGNVYDIWLSIPEAKLGDGVNETGQVCIEIVGRTGGRHVMTIWEVKDHYKASCDWESQNEAGNGHALGPFDIDFGEGRFLPAYGVRALSLWMRAQGCDPHSLNENKRPGQAERAERAAYAEHARKEREAAAAARECSEDAEEADAGEDEDTGAEP